MGKPTLNLTDFVILTGLFMGALVVHQMVVAPRIAKK
jgi:hypothetical protein